MSAAQVLQFPKRAPAPKPAVAKCECGKPAPQHRCDFPVRGSYCNRPLCKKCVTLRPNHSGDTADYCPEHSLRVTPEGRYKL